MTPAVSVAWKNPLIVTEPVVLVPFEIIKLSHALDWLKDVPLYRLMIVPNGAPPPNVKVYTPDILGWKVYGSYLNTLPPNPLHDNVPVL